MPGPPADPDVAHSALGHLAAAALAALDGAEPDPTLDELAEAIQVQHAPRERRQDPNRPYVLVIDPDGDTRAVLAGLLEDAGCSVVAALRTSMTAEYAVRQHQPTVVVVDLELQPGGVRRGLLLVASLADEAPHLPLLVLAQPGLGHEVAEQAVRAGARRVLPKRDLDGLVAAVREAHASFVRATSPPGGPTSGTPEVGGR